MKIAIDARLWNQGGVGRYIRNLTRNLAIIDKNNDYLLFTRSEDLKDMHFKNPRFKTVKADFSWHSMEEQFELPKIIERERPDLVHFPYHSVPIFYSKPFVVTIHDLIPFHFHTGKASTLPFPLYKIKFFFYKKIVKKAALNSKKIIAPSNFSKKEIVNLLKVQPSKIEVIYEGTDESLIGQIKKASKKEHFLYVGNAYPHKNLDMLIEVFEELSQYKLILVGKDDYFYKQLRKKTRNFKNIRFFGEATDKELLELYKKAKAIIIPSFIEGFGLPALEAMSNRCIVLASDIPALREICSDAAIYFAPQNKSELRAKLTNISNSENKSLIEKGQERAKKFSWRKTAEETLRIYESCNSLR